MNCNFRRVPRGMIGFVGGEGIGVAAWGRDFFMSGGCICCILFLRNFDDPECKFCGEIKFDGFVMNLMALLCGTPFFRFRNRRKSQLV